MKRRGFLGLLALLLPVSAVATRPTGIDASRYLTVYRDGRFTVFDFNTAQKYQIQADSFEEREEYDLMAEIEKTERIMARNKVDPPLLILDEAGHIISMKQPPFH